MIQVLRDHKSFAASHYANCKNYISSVRNLYLHAFNSIIADPNISYTTLRTSYSDAYLHQNSITSYLKMLYTRGQVNLKEEYKLCCQSYYNFVRRFTLREIEQLIITPYYSNPSLDELNSKWLASLYQYNPEFFALDSKKVFTTEFTDIINSLLDYDQFIGDGFGQSGSIKYSAYDLAKKLDVRVCPYCNRNFTLTVLNPSKINGVREKICRPQFDHLLPKSEFVFLRISYYNLVPSCGTCNHIKLDEDIDPENFSHPYFEGFENNGRFTIRPLSAGSLFGINPDYEFDFDFKNSKIEKNKEVFFLKEIYHKHSYYICDLIEREKMVGPDLAAHLKAYYTGKGVTIGDKEIHEFLYPMIKDDDARSRYPLSKFLADIYESYMALKP